MSKRTLSRDGVDGRFWFAGRQRALTANGLPEVAAKGANLLHDLDPAKPAERACYLLSGMGAETGLWLGRDLGEERLEHPPGLLGPRFDGTAHLANMAGGRARIR